MSSHRDLPASELTRHAEFLRRLVRDLVRDEDRVEEVIQDTWLTALERRRSRPGSERGWLGGIARNLARRSAQKEQRRARRRVPLDEAMVAAEAGRQVAVTREVAEALDRLDERYRTVLVLRYLRDLPPRVIARDTGLSLEATKTRLKRGLILLRQRLDARHEGDRQAWAGALLPLAAAPRGLATLAAVTTGAAVMKLKLAALGVVVVVAAVVAWRALDDEGAREPGGRGESAGPANVAETEAPEAGGALQRIEGRPFAPGDQAEGSRPPGLQSGQWGVRGVLRWREADPIAGVALRFRIAGPTRELIARSGEGGRFSLVLDEEASISAVGAVIDGDPVRVVLGLPQPPTAKRPADRWVDWDVELPGPSSLAGRVLDTAGNPVAGIGIRVGTTTQEHSLHSQLHLTGEDGRFAFTLPYEGVCRLEVWPRLDPRGTAADTGDIAAIRKATLTRQGVPETYDSITFRPLRRPGDGLLEMWPLEPERSIVLGRGTPCDVGTLVVGAPGRIDLVVTDERDDPVEGVRLTAGCPVRKSTLVTAPTDDGGRAGLEFAPGEHRVWLRVDGLTLADRKERLEGVPVTVPAGGRVEVPVRVSRTSPFGEPAEVVTVRVVDEYQTPVAGATIRWNGQERVTNAEGRAPLAKGDGRKALLRIEAEGFRTHERKDFVIHPRFNHFVLRSRETAWLVVRDAEGRPVGELNVLKLDVRRGKGGRLDQRIFDQPRVLRHADGRHPIPPLQAGGRMSTLLLWSRQSGIARLDFSRGLAAGAVHEVTLRAVSVVRGRLEDEGGKPVAGARLVTGASDFPPDVIRVIELEGVSSAAGALCVGEATSTADGRFSVLAPEKDGVLAVVRRDGGGLLRRYASASELTRLVLGEAPRVTLRASRAPELDQEIFVELEDEIVKQEVRAPWPAGERQIVVALPHTGRWKARLLPKLLPGFRWGGLTGGVTLDVAGRALEASIELAEYVPPRR